MPVSRAEARLLRLISETGLAGGAERGPRPRAGAPPVITPLAPSTDGVFGDRTRQRLGMPVSRAEARLLRLISETGLAGGAERGPRPRAGAPPVITLLAPSTDGVFGDRTRQRLGMPVSRAEARLLRSISETGLAGGAERGPRPRAGAPPVITLLAPSTDGVFGDRTRQRLGMPVSRAEARLLRPISETGLAGGAERGPRPRAGAPPVITLLAPSTDGVFGDRTRQRLGMPVSRAEARLLRSIAETDRAGGRERAPAPRHGLGAP